MGQAAVRAVQHGHPHWSVPPASSAPRATAARAGDVTEVTGGFVQYFDLTLSLSLRRADWVMALEVGESCSVILRPP